MTKIKILAPAKLNLYLEVLGRQNNGYHELESQAIFLKLADELTFLPAPNLQIIATNIGSEIADNIIIKTAQKLQNFFGISSGAEILLEKKIPIAAGLGGGSADAAATIIGLQKLWNFAASEADLYAIATQLGADVSACLYGHLAEENSVKFSGVGEKLSAAEAPENLHFVLVNPCKHLSTAEVFANVAGFLPTTNSTDFKLRRNDLQTAAQKLMPEITEILTAIAVVPNCQLARMTGSGATCFGVFGNMEQAQKAAKNLKTNFPNYWVECTSLK